MSHQTNIRKGGSPCLLTMYRSSPSSVRQRLTVLPGILVDRKQFNPISRLFRHIEIRHRVSPFTNDRGYLPSVSTPPDSLDKWKETDVDTCVNIHSTTVNRISPCTYSTFPNRLVRRRERFDPQSHRHGHERPLGRRKGHQTGNEYETFP